MGEGKPEVREAILAAVSEAYRGLEGPDDRARWSVLIVIARP
jgi:hypothetical protein